MDIPYWEFGGHTVVTSNYIRLTPDRQSKQGMLWNTVVRHVIWKCEVVHVFDRLSVSRLATSTRENMTHYDKL